MDNGNYLKKNNAMIDQFDQEYTAVNSDHDGRSMSLNSKAQQIAEKHRF
jgi:hypothetical protein